MQPFASTHIDGEAEPLTGDSTRSTAIAVGPAPVTRRPRRRLRRTVVALVIVGAAVLGLTGTATADGTAIAHSYGMQCSAQYGWVRQNYPNISTSSYALQDVYFKSTLQLYTTSGWRSVRTSVWFHGVSNYTGRKALGYWGGQPYYFAYNSSTGTRVGPERGPAFTGLTAGYYRKIETCWANGSQWARYSYNAAYSSSTYCYA